MSGTASQIDDLEALLQPYARRPPDREWLPISLFTMQDRSVAVAIRPAGVGKVIVTDEGETLTYMRDLGVDVEPNSASSRDIELLATKRGFRFDGFAFAREVTPDEIPTAALHLAEVEIAVSGLLHTRYMVPEANIFSTEAREILHRELKPKVAKLVKFGSQYAGRYQDGEFFCVAEEARPVGVKLITNMSNMRDAVIVGMMYEKEPIDLVALRKPRVRLSGPRVVQFATLYANHTFDRVEKLATYLNDRLAG
jgi:hypothetical protein